MSKANVEPRAVPQDRCGVISSRPLQPLYRADYRRCALARYVTTNAALSGCRFASSTVAVVKIASSMRYARKARCQQLDAVTFSAFSIHMSRQYRRSQPVGEARDRAMLVSTGVISLKGER